ncbi:interleukin-7 receptor subunit alpha [Carettochelys insculpta]|uniref:interleukin-7 receptor subunit alpha n=1 Tax=Carettochelys insculpta TaxID=44489 RepID=UPI003EB70F07
MLRMTRTSTALVILLFSLLLLHITSEDNGDSGSSGNWEDDELDLDFECFSQLEIMKWSHSLTCSFMELNHNNTNITVCTNFEKRVCSTMEKQENTYFLCFYEILSPRDICVVLESKRMFCRKVNVTNIVKPEAPFGINITFQKEANEYLIQYSTPHSKKKYLKGKLIHEIAYRQENRPWKTKESQYLQIKLLGKSLQRGASYEVKVRSKPNGQFFKGIWSEWSTSNYFQTAAGPQPNERMQKETTPFSNGILWVTIPTMGFILLFTMLVLILWKTRIKPLLWPKLPDHKKTLEQLCKKPIKNFDISFNPESFGYVHIHKVDGIQATAEVESFLQPSAPLDTDVSEKVENGSAMKSLTDVEKSVLKLPVSYGGIWPSDTLSRHLCETHPFVLEGFSNGIPCKVCSSNGTQLYNCDPMTHSTSSADLTVQPGSGPINTNTVSQIQPSNRIRSSNKDEAYVTMTSFCKNQ